jgi:hypothetical protein
MTRLRPDLIQPHDSIEPLDLLAVGLAQLGDSLVQARDQLLQPLQTVQVQAQFEAMVLPKLPPCRT